MNKFSLFVYLIAINVSLFASISSSNDLKHKQQETIKFSKKEFYFKTFENATSPIGKLSIQNDLEVEYSITLNGNGSSFFFVEKKTFEVKPKLDQTAKKGTYYLKVSVKNETVVTSCLLTIDVSDYINRAAEFKSLIYSAQIVENNAPDTLVARVDALDRDYGENGRLTYHLVASLNSTSVKDSLYNLPFQIKSDTGEVYARKSLNREQKDFYTLNIMAIDNGTPRLSTVTQLNVRVLPQGDSAPKFSTKELSLTLNENSDFQARPIVLNVSATDCDNSTSVTYSLSGSLNDLNTFEIESTNGAIRLVSKLSHETKSVYRLNVIAKDFAQPARASQLPLTIFINDLNPNPPSFNAPFYEFILFENAAVGSFVGRVQAMHRSEKVMYSINVETDLKKFPFVVDPSNGTISTVRKVYKTMRHGYEFYVVAGGGNSVNNATVKVRIRILDMNDNVPEFSRAVYRINVSEEAAVGLPLLSLNAANREPNSALDYSIEAGDDEARVFGLVKQGNDKAFLTIERTGLNYKKKSNYDLTVKVMDQDGLYSSASVQISVIPKDIYTPRFTKDIYNIQVAEDSGINSLVGTISASSLSSEDGGRIVFKIMSNTDGNDAESLDVDFRLDENTGNLYVANLLDREKYEMVSLYVTASEIGRPQLMDHAIVQIQLLDVNDNAPVFTRNAYEFEARKGMRVGSFLSRVEAVDKDLGQNGIVKYSTQNTHNLIELDSNSGIIRLAREINENDPPFMNLTITATDLGQNPLNSSIHCLLKIVDREKMAPVFDDEFEFEVGRESPSGTVLGEISGRDPDYGGEANIVYKLLSHTDSFELRPSGKFNTVHLVLKSWVNLEKRVFDLRVRGYSMSLFSDCSVRVRVKSGESVALKVPSTFKIIFNNYKNYFLTENSPYVPIIESDPSVDLFFSLKDSIGRQMVSLDAKTGRITFNPILNSNNFINVSFSIGVSDGSKELVTQCELVAVMLSDNLIAQSATLNFQNIDASLFLASMHNQLVSFLLSKIQPKLKTANVHIFNIINTESGVNVTLSISYEYEKDIFMPGETLKQLLYAHIEILQSLLRVGRIFLYEEASCSIEPCLNYQKCVSKVKFASAGADFVGSNVIQLRPISVRHDFACVCPLGFTGTKTSLTCDLEINLCYSNPCGNNGVCVSLESSFVCLCEPGHTGRLCDVELKKARCCDSEYPASTRNAKQKPRNLQRVAANNLTCVSSGGVSEIWSSNQEASLNICKGSSRCKNLILGGVLCDKCGADAVDKSFYNKFCELRGRHFPVNRRAYLTLPGVQNRHRFKVRLTFSTIKSNSFVFYNERIDRESNYALDFIALKVHNGYLRFVYSLGGDEIETVSLDEVSVSDGKWRTVSVEYRERNVSLSLDDDESFEVDSCELATSVKCYRKSAFFNLESRCVNQMETCYRFLDLNGPLHVGRGPRSVSNLNYEGCISDIFINEKMSDLDRDILNDYRTEAGCLPKVDVCKLRPRNQCSSCRHVWADKAKCECGSEEFAEGSFCTQKIRTEIYSLSSNGHIALNKPTHSELSFHLKLAHAQSEQIILTQFRLDEEIFSLLYEANKQKVELINETNGQILFQAGHNLHDGYWNKIELKLLQRALRVTIDDLISYEMKNPSSTIEEIFIGGPSRASNSNATSINGCVKQIPNGLFNLQLSSNVSFGCEIKAKKIDPVAECFSGMCLNNGTCVASASEPIGFRCMCESGFKGRFCEYDSGQMWSAFGSSSVNSTCPAKWWGKVSCGPCECDETKNFSPDCDKSTGQCGCKPKFYKQMDAVTREERCVPCDCYLEGSSSLQCEPYTGQCKCLSGAGITGRRCDQCVSPFAEMTQKGNECRQLSTSNECPRAFKFNIWWPRVEFNSVANASCPKGASGVAYLRCTNIGWSNLVDLNECKSSRIVDSQLLKWSQILTINSTLLNSYQALQLAEDLEKLTREAENEDESNDEMTNSLSTGAATLYAFDLLVVKNLTKQILEYDAQNAPSFLYIQDKYFLTNIFSTLNRILGRKYELKLNQLRHGEHFNFVDLLLTLRKYLNSILTHNEYSFKDKLEISLSNFKFSMRRVESSWPFVRLKAEEEVSLISAGISSSNLPSEMDESDEKFKLVSDVLIVGGDENEPRNFSTIKIDFVLNKLYDVDLVEASDEKMMKSFKLPYSSSFYCARLNGARWSLVHRVELGSFQFEEANWVKCEAKERGVFGVLTSVDEQANLVSAPINFLISAYFILPIALTFLFLTLLILMFLRAAFQLKFGTNFRRWGHVLMIAYKNYGTTLSHIYTNLCITVLLSHAMFLFGVNSNNSPLLCKFIAIAQHYLQLSAYLWLFSIVLHSYRMLTELRDINKCGSRVPLLYYAVSCAIPAIIVSLTLGLKQHIYTNFFTLNDFFAASNFKNFFSSSLYCFLCLANHQEILYVLILPISVVLILTVLLAIYSLIECKRNTYKQTDVPIVRHNLSSTILILTLQSGITLFLTMFVYMSSLPSRLNSFKLTLYQYLYLTASLTHSVTLLLAFVLFNKHIKCQLASAWNSLLSKNHALNESLDASQLKLYAKSPCFKNILAAKKNNSDSANQILNKQPEIFKVNSRYVLDYRESSNDLDYHNNNQQQQQQQQQSDGFNLKQNYLMSGYLSHLANTTNTESTVNDSELMSQYEFNRAPLPSNSEVSECDVIDVGKILKTRHLANEVNVKNAIYSEPPNKYHQADVQKCYNSDTTSRNAQIKKNLSLFWPNTIAECDTSFQDGSATYTPKKFPFSTNNLNQPDLLSCSAALSVAQKLALNNSNSKILTNTSYHSSNGGSNSSSSSTSGASNNYSASTSSLILNSNSSDQMTNVIQVSRNENYISSQKIVPVLTHTGSATTSDNESSNETRV